MQRVLPDREWPLHGVAATRRIEQGAIAGLAEGTLMARAGLSVARLALAIAPHARTVWIACGPGNNGGDGLEAAKQLRQWGKQVAVTQVGQPGLPPAEWDLAIDALLGIGGNRPLAGEFAELAARMNASSAPVLAIDVPSGLDADTGNGAAVRATHTITFLTLKPGLFTGGGRDACGEVWFDALGVTHQEQATARLAGPPAPVGRPHASHKGTWGDVAVIGGAPGMAGAALLAASAALHGGAGRVFVGLLDPSAPALDAGRPELMLRDAASLDLATMYVACGCGGGHAVAAVMPRVLGTAAGLVLDADALNAIAADSQLFTLLRSRTARGKPTVLTPHPLEAARLLGATTAEVQSDRLAAAAKLAAQTGCVVVLKGSGTVLAAPGETPVVNPTGNARLATAGTGDVLAGAIAARMAAGLEAFTAAQSAVFAHGRAADRWEAHRPLVAADLARRLFP